MPYNFFFCYFVQKINNKPLIIEKKSSRRCLGSSLKLQRPSTCCHSLQPPYPALLCLFFHSISHLITLYNLLIYYVHYLLPVSLAKMHAPQKQRSLFCLPIYPKGLELCPTHCVCSNKHLLSE